MRKWTLKFENTLELHMKSREQVLKSIRKVNRSATSTIGHIASIKNGGSLQHESSLEADFIQMLEFDLRVDRFIEQPVKIEYTDEKGKSRSYTPDILVYFKSGVDGQPFHPPLLCEVKPRHLIKKNWDQLKPKFRAAIKYCQAVGWVFEIKTDLEIKTQHTKNIKFLLPYMRRTPDFGFIEKIEYVLIERGPSTVKEIISYYSSSAMGQAELVAPLWFLVGNQRLGCNLNEELTLESKIWILNRTK